MYIHFVIYFQYAYVLTHVWLFTTLWTVTCQAPLSMGFSRQEYWSGLPFPPTEDFSNPGIEPSSPVSPALQADSLLRSHRESPENLKRVHEEARERMLISALFVKARPTSKGTSRMRQMYVMEHCGNYNRQENKPDSPSAHKEFFKTQHRVGETAFD